MTQKRLRAAALIPLEVIKMSKNIRFDPPPPNKVGHAENELFITSMTLLNTAASLGGDRIHLPDENEKILYKTTTTETW